MVSILVHGEIGEYQSILTGKFKILYLVGIQLYVPILALFWC